MSREMESLSTPCHLDFRTKPLAAGINSSLWRIGGNVLKAYRISASGTGLYTDEANLLLYREVMNESDRLTRTEKWKIKLPFPHGERDLRVNPYLTLSKCERCGYKEGLSPFIPGKNFESFRYLPWHEAMKEAYFEIQYRLEKRLEVTGIWPSAVNTKLQAGSLVLTDLCLDIADIQRK